MFCKTDDVCSTWRDTCVPCDDDKDQLAPRYIGSCWIFRSSLAVVVARNWRAFATVARDDVLFREMDQCLRKCDYNNINRKDKGKPEDCTSEDTPENPKSLLLLREVAHSLNLNWMYEPAVKFVESKLNSTRFVPFKVGHCGSGIHSVHLLVYLSADLSIYQATGSAYISPQLHINYPWNSIKQFLTIWI